jgi:hypothetical protein
MSVSVIPASVTNALQAIRNALYAVGIKEPWKVRLSQWLLAVWQSQVLCNRLVQFELSDTFEC